MRFLFILALTCLIPAEVGAKAVAGAKKGQKAARKIANKMPTRVLTFVCRDSDDSQNAFGLTHMTISLRDSSTGAFSTSIYLRTEKGYTPKTISGTYTTVPGGFVFRTKWQSAAGEYTMIHVHPAEKTIFPGMANAQLCEVSAQLESI